MNVPIGEARDDDVPALADPATRTWLDAFGDSVEPTDAAADVRARRSEERLRAALDERFGFRRVGETSFSIGSEVVEDLVCVLER